MAALTPTPLPSRTGEGSAESSECMIPTLRGRPTEYDEERHAVPLIVFPLPRSAGEGLGEGGPPVLSALCHRRPPSPDLRRLLEGVGELQDTEVVVMTTDDLDSDRQPLGGEAAGD